MRQAPRKAETVSEDVTGTSKSEYKEQSLAQEVSKPPKVETLRFIPEYIEEIEVPEHEAMQKPTSHITESSEQVVSLEIDGPTEVIHDDITPETLKESVNVEKAHKYIALAELAEEYKEVESLEIHEIVGEYETDEIHQSTEEPPMMIDQIADYITQNVVMNEEQKVKADLLTQEITVISQEIIELKVAENLEDSEYLEQIEERLEKVCVELFEIMGVEYDEEMVKRFVQTIVRQEIAKKLKVLEKEEIIDEGMHERKHFTLSGVVSGLRDDMQRLYSLGKYAVAVTM